MNQEFFNDRDMSWLSFNKRVLDEARFNDVKIYDKIKFVAIHASNLDEFARVRLAALEGMADGEAGTSHPENVATLQAARSEVFKQGASARQIMEDVVFPGLEENGIHLYHGDEALAPVHYEEAMHIFMSKVLSYLQPVIITRKQNIFLEDRVLYFLVHVDAGRRLNDLKIVLNIPSHALPRFFMLSPCSGQAIHHLP